MCVFNDVNIVVNNHSVIEKVSSIKYLEVVLGNRLCWNEHIADFETKIIKLKLDLFHLLRAYLTVYRLELSYDIIHWRGAATCHINKLKQFQNYLLLKSIYCDKISFRNNNMLTVKDLYEIRLIEFVFKSINLSHITTKKLINRNNKIGCHESIN